MVASVSRSDFIVAVISSVEPAKRLLFLGFLVGDLLALGRFLLASLVLEDVLSNVACLVGVGKVSEPSPSRSSGCV